MTKDNIYIFPYVQRIQTGANLEPSPLLINVHGTGG